MTESRKETEARRVKRRTKQLATERYAEYQNDIGALLGLVGDELKAHAEAAAKRPTAWGYAGDLMHTRESLKEILISFLVGRHGWSETEAYRFIEDHLEAMHE